MTNSQSTSRVGVSIQDALEARHTRRRVGRLTLSRAREASARSTGDEVIIAHRADREALEVLRFEGVSYHVEETGETYLAPLKPAQPPKPRHTTGLFSRRASRIARWLLLHPDESFSVSQLAEAVGVDKSIASRAVAALTRESLVHVDADSHDWRARAVSLAAPQRLLEEWRIEYRRRRPIRQRFDIETRTVERTLSVLADAQSSVPYPWVISGLAGVMTHRRVVEPADVLLLTTEEGLARWRKALLADPSPDRGLLQIAVVSDLYVFELADRNRGPLPVADAVQLWLDTIDSGERAAVAAAALADEMGWNT